MEAGEDLGVCNVAHVVLEIGNPKRLLFSRTSQSLPTKSKIKTVSVSLDRSRRDRQEDGLAVGHE